MTGFRITNLIVVLVVAAAATIAAAELARVLTAAQAINDKAQTIAASGRGINIATDSVIQLNRTNQIARSILDSARPLDQKLAQIVDEAQGINGVASAIDGTAGQIDDTAGSINSTAGAINDTAGEINTVAGRIDTIAGDIDSTAEAIDSTAGRINDVAGAINTTATTIDSTAGGIDGEAGEILNVAQLIDRDVRLVNVNLNDSIRLAGQIRSDTRDILTQAVRAHDTASCIDQRLQGRLGTRELAPGPPPDHCRNRPPHFPAGSAASAEGGPGGEAGASSGSAEAGRSGPSAEPLVPELGRGERPGTGLPGTGPEEGGARRPSSRGDHGGGLQRAREILMLTGKGIAR